MTLKDRCKHLISKSSIKTLKSSKEESHSWTGLLKRDKSWEMISCLKLKNMISTYSNSCRKIEISSSYTIMIHSKYSIGNSSITTNTITVETTSIIEMDRIMITNITETSQTMTISTIETHKIMIPLIGMCRTTIINTISITKETIYNNKTQ
jgi:hypothetical protein